MVLNTYDIHACNHGIYTHANTLTHTYKHTLTCAHSYICKCTKVCTGCVHRNRSKNKNCLNFLGWCVLHVCTNVLMSKVLHAESVFHLSGVTTILFQSPSHVLPVPLDDIMTGDRWLKKLQLAVFFIFSLSASFSSP